MHEQYRIKQNLYIRALQSCIHFQFVGARTNSHNSGAKLRPINFILMTAKPPLGSAHPHRPSNFFSLLSQQTD